jgi:hypothetical protein
MKACNNSVKNLWIFDTHVLQMLVFYHIYFILFLPIYVYT